jgi:hypothetical protein
VKTIGRNGIVTFLAESSTGFGTYASVGIVASTIGPEIEHRTEIQYQSEIKIMTVGNTTNRRKDSSSKLP